MSEATAEILISYIKSNPKTYPKTLHVLGTIRPFMDAFNTEIGKELLKEVIATHELLLNKISDLQASDEEKMEYKVLKGILIRWSEKIDKYNKACAELNK